MHAITSAALDFGGLVAHDGDDSVREVELALGAICVDLLTGSVHGHSEASVCYQHPR